MPVKLTSDGKPLEASLKQKAAPAPAAAAAPAQAPSAVDALLDVADQVPAATTVVAKAEVGSLNKDGHITVETTEHVKTGLKAQPAYEGPYGKVTYGVGSTVNTGNYENFRPFVQIEIPFIPGQENETYTYAEEWANSRITNIVKAAKAAVSGA